MIVSCGASGRFAVAERASDDLHRRIEGREVCYQVYDLSADNLKKHNLETDFVAFMSGFSSASGNCRSSALQSKQAWLAPGVDVVELSYRRECGKRNVIETIDWEIAGDRCQKLSSFDYSVAGTWGLSRS